MCNLSYHFLHKALPVYLKCYGDTLRLKESEFLDHFLGDPRTTINFTYYLKGKCFLFCFNYHYFISGKTDHSMAGYYNLPGPYFHSTQTAGGSQWLMLKSWAPKSNCPSYMVSSLRKGTVVNSPLGSHSTNMHGVYAMRFLLPRYWKCSK